MTDDERGVRQLCEEEAAWDCLAIDIVRSRNPDLDGDAFWDAVDDLPEEELFAAAGIEDVPLDAFDLWVGE